MVPSAVYITDKNKIGPSEPCFIIAEIGQNHQGNINIAMELIRTAKECGADCVKFQKSCLEEKFTAEALNKPYESEHSWGSTYGIHKQYLEFNEEQYRDLQEYARSLDIVFTASAMDPTSLDFLVELDVPLIKIGSGDGDNWILLKKAADTRKPLIVSTGMQDMDSVIETYSLLSSVHKKFVLLHCVSAYPHPPEETHLKVLNTYQQQFKDINIGYSGHEYGYNITLAAVAMGAKVVERHITMVKTWKGNDHQSSLNPEEFKTMVSAIREIEKAMGQAQKKLQPCEMCCLKKLGKCGVAARRLKAGTILQARDVKIKVAGEGGLRPSELRKMMGRTLITPLNPDQMILSEHFA